MNGGRKPAHIRANFRNYYFGSFPRHTWNTIQTFNGRFKRAAVILDFGIKPLKRFI